jgi:hypothetical protein
MDMVLPACGVHLSLVPGSFVGLDSGVLSFLWNLSPLVHGLVLSTACALAFVVYPMLTRSRAIRRAELLAREALEGRAGKSSIESRVIECIAHAESALEGDFESASAHVSDYYWNLRRAQIDKGLDAEPFEWSITEVREVRPLLAFLVPDDASGASRVAVLVKGVQGEGSSKRLIEGVLIFETFNGEWVLRSSESSVAAWDYACSMIELQDAARFADAADRQLELENAAALEPGSY